MSKSKAARFTSLFNLSISAHAPLIKVVSHLGYKLSSPDEGTRLNDFIWNGLHNWGVVPDTKTTTFGHYSHDCSLVRELITEFFNPEAVGINPPSPTWADAMNMAVALKIDGAEFWRSSLNEFVWINLVEIHKLYPIRGRSGATGLNVNPRDGGIYPVNNSLIIGIVKNYFGVKEGEGVVTSALTNTFEGRKYIPRVK